MVLKRVEIYAVEIRQVVSISSTDRMVLKRDWLTGEFIMTKVSISSTDRMVLKREPVDRDQQQVGRFNILYGSNGAEANSADIKACVNIVSFNILYGSNGAEARACVTPKA